MNLAPCILCFVLLTGVGGAAEPAVHPGNQVIGASVDDTPIGRLDVSGFPHLAATPENIADCAGFHRFLSEERIDIGPDHGRSF